MRTRWLHRLLTERLLLTVLLAASVMRPAVPAAEVDKAIVSAVQAFVDAHTLAGAVMVVASKDTVLSLEAVGFADIAAGKPMKSDALFWIASQSKPMTAAALMMLVDEGKVSLDDPVEKYLPEFKDQMLAVERDAGHVLLRKPAHSITAREVLSHTSGLPFSSPMEQPTLDGLPLRDAVRSYAMMSLQFPPGTKYQYSNAGIYDGKHLLSEAAVQQLTSRQTAPEIKDSYGLGFAVGADWCGHGGAYATNTQIDRKHGLIFVWMVQHNGFPGNGSKSQDAFKQAALAAFAR